MTVAFLSNERLEPAINWSTLGPPFRAAMSQLGCAVVTPGKGRSARGGLQAFREVRQHDVAFWLQLSARPETRVLGLGLAAKRRSAWVADAWPYSITNIARVAATLRIDPCFIAFKEAIEPLRSQTSKVQFEHLPFGVDTNIFKPRALERDIFAFWMGRRHEPLHYALHEYCHKRGLRYVTSQGGRISDPHHLGKLVSRSRYFVVTTPDVDHPQRAGGFSPLVMRYLEGLAAGSRLLGTRPRSGELDALGLTAGLLEVEPDGSDLADLLDRDQVEDYDEPLALASDLVIKEHSWVVRAETVVRRLTEGI